MSLEATNAEAIDPNIAVSRLVEASLETLTDEMVGRLAKTASDSLTLLDDLNRSRLNELLPVISEMAASGDLARLAALARVWGAAEDALTDDLVGRLAGLASGMMTIMDHFNGDTGHVKRLWESLAEALTPALMERAVKSLPAILELLGQAQESGLLQEAMAGVERARRELATLPRPAGGVAGLWALFKDADNQRTIQALLLYGRHVLGFARKA